MALPETRAAVNALSKGEAMIALQTLGIQLPEDWSAEEVRHVLKEQLFLASDAGAPTQYLAGLAGAKKSDLLDRCERLGVDCSDKETKVKLQGKIRDKVVQMTRAQGTDLVGFGQYRHLTYQQLREDKPSYCRWLCAEAASEETCWQLRRLAGWLNSVRVAPPVEEQIMPPPVPPGASAGSSGLSVSEREKMETEIRALQAQLAEATTLPRKAQMEEAVCPSPQQVPSTQSGGAMAADVPVTQQIEQMTMLLQGLMIRMDRLEAAAVPAEPTEDSWVKDDSMTTGRAPKRA